jgi:hypothetical protein
MATHHDAITPEQRALIEESRLFFVASAHTALEPGPEGQGGVNVSPKGNVPLEVIGPNSVAYLDYHGSGNETARHLEAGGPVTVMVMSLSADDAAIVRLYGRGHAEPVEESPLAERLLVRCREKRGLRQVIRIDVEHTQTSCGYGVPVYEYVADRESSQRGRQFKA